MNENEKYNFSGKTDCMCGSLSNSGTFLCDSRKIFLEFQQLKREFFRKFYDAYSSEEWNPNEILIVCKFTVWRTRGKIYKAKHNSIESLSLPQCAMPSSFSLWNARFCVAAALVGWSSFISFSTIESVVRNMKIAGLSSLTTNWTFSHLTESCESKKLRVFPSFFFSAIEQLLPSNSARGSFKLSNKRCGIFEYFLLYHVHVPTINLLLQIFPLKLLLLLQFSRPRTTQYVKRGGMMKTECRSIRVWNLNFIIHSVAVEW